MSEPDVSPSPPSARVCTQCGAVTSSTTLAGLCDKCLLGEALGSGEGQFGQPEREFGEDVRHFGDYELGQQLGRGGMGVVYEAMQRSLRRPVALKMILDSHLVEPLARRRFTIEAEAAAKLDHPHIVPIYEVGEHDGQPFLSMKLIAGKNLREKIASGELCLKPKGNGTSRADLRARTTAVIQLMATVARAVDHAHEKNVLHRDLKPGNILVDADGKPHLTDFGLAKILDHPLGDHSPASTSALESTSYLMSEPITDSGATLGTPSYMSPEQATGKRVSRASDTYSLGAILYEMLTGAPPFKAPSVLETLRLVTDQQARRPSTENPRVDRDLDTICLKCLDKNPAARYSSALALAEDLERWLRQEPIRARPASAWMRSTRWVRRNPVGAALIISLFVGLSLALVLLRANLEQQRRDKFHKGVLTQKFEAEVQRLWEDVNRTNIHLLPAELAAISNHDFRDSGPDAIRLTLALSVADDPISQARKYAPLLRRIEEKMQKVLGRPVVFSLSLYKLIGGAVPHPVMSGDADFQRLGPLAYVQARQSTPGLQPIAAEINSQETLARKEAVIFARRDAPITNLSQVTGHRVAFAHTNSIISFMTKVLLARAGVTARQLASSQNFDEIASSAAINPQHDDTAVSGAFAHRLIIQKVLAEEYDVGEALRRHFEFNKHKGKGLRELHSLLIPPDVYVASPGLDPSVVDAFRQSLTTLNSRRDKEILLRLQRANVLGFSPMTDRDFDTLRAALTNEFMWFETGLSKPAVVPASLPQRSGNR